MSCTNGTTQEQGQAAPAGPFDNPGKLDSSLILYVGIVGTIIVAVTFMATEAFYRNVQQRDVEANSYAQPNLQLTEYMARQQQMLHTLKWNEADKKTATVSIEQAIEAYAAGAGK